LPAKAGLEAEHTGAARPERRRGWGSYKMASQSCRRGVELRPPEQIRTSIQGEAAQLTLIGEKAGTLLVRDTHMRMYAVDLGTGRMKELTFCGQVNRWKVVPFEIYWPTF
jgi:hypothetical protein